jgi:hypothetical protein
MENPIMPKGAKTLKVRFGFYDYPTPVPFILLKGYWLQASNYDLKDAVSLQKEINQILLLGPQIPNLTH